MKYVFFGTPRFAAIVLERLLSNGHPPVALVANPDRPVGRKKIVTPPPTKILLTVRGALAGHANKDIPLILQPEKLDTVFMEKIRALEPDFFIVAAYAKIIPKEVLAIPRLGTIGVHPSLLPKYRGASPIQSAILGGETMTGVTLYLVDEKMDHGPVLAAEKIAIDPLRVTTSTLGDLLANLGGDMAAKLIPEFIEGNAASESQDETLATYTKKFSVDDGSVTADDLDAAEHGDKEKARDILLKINALGEEPGVWSSRDGVHTKLLKVNLTPEGALRLVSLQHDGGMPFTPPNSTSSRGPLNDLSLF